MTCWTISSIFILPSHDPSGDRFQCRSRYWCRYFHREVKVVEGCTMHTYTVELRIIGDISGERDISSRLGMSATSFFQKGESKSPTRQWEKSVWAFAIEPSNGQKEWDSLEKGLKNLVDRFLP